MRHSIVYLSATLIQYEPNIISVWKIRLLGTETSLHQEKGDDGDPYSIVREVKEMKE